MSTISQDVSISKQPADPFWPEPATIESVDDEVPGVATLRLTLQDRRRRAKYRFMPGQFNMLYLPGIGEVAISISSAPRERRGIAHTIRCVGTVTRVIEQLQAGAVIGLRGAYGKGWPLDDAHDKDVLVVAGGLGLAPLRPAIKALLAERRAYGKLLLLYGARHPTDLLYQREYTPWRKQGLETQVTVDHADSSWTGQVGVVPALLGRLDFDPQRTIVFTCGPEIMMRFTVYELLARGVPAERIFVSLERNMQCGVGMCGRCQLGPYFLCKDGPVFAYSKIGRFMRQEHF